MLSNTHSRVKVIHYACAALLLVLLLMQFTPFWHWGESGENAVSISSYIWFPTDHADLTAHIQDSVHSAFTINSILIPCILMLLLSAAGVLLCTVKPGSILSSLVAAACGLSGVIGFLTQSALRLGAVWAWMLLICILLLAAGVYTLGLSLGWFRR